MITDTERLLFLEKELCRNKATLEYLEYNDSFQFTIGNYILIEKELCDVIDKAMDYKRRIA